MSNKVFCIGELLIDFIGKDNIKDLSKTVNFEKKAGGAPANVAASVCKLGGEAYFLGQVGNDSFGKFLIESLKKVDINVEMTKMEGYTTLAFVSIDEKGERDFEFHRGSDGDYRFSSIDLSKISDKDIIHFGSATGFLEGELKNTYYKLLEYAKENNIFISFDPNYRDALITKDKLEAFIEDCKNFIKLSDFVKLSDEEIKLITEEESIELAVKKLHKMGAKIVAVTLGAKGTLISNGASEIVPSIKIKQVDSTGAGDAFVGAVLKQLSEQEDNKNISFSKWKEIVSYANKVGAITCTNYGAIDAMPRAEDLQDN
ncbi:carbohydrate kinase family protein [Clostridium isatidis]|uniref:Fructokinase n=1 Tax=Clostridium isatidis TaxID=182773 RepID=A0A343JCM6_9CLOT|nr:carbohydrate kinase [Clostridium isatidis]ASW43284.1 fructokinase [Clostridium isatidis]NLZ34580.1 carbohydrate kinase [Clostridiales bacterium]